MKWLKAFSRSIHPSEFRKSFKDLYKILYMYHVDKALNKYELKKYVGDLVKLSRLSATQFAYRLMPRPAGEFAKTAGYLDDMAALTDKRLNQEMTGIIMNAISLGEGPPVSKLEPKLGSYESAKAAARTLMLNYYTKSYLEKWQAGGLRMVKRIEMHDHKTCPLCRSLNSNIYSIEEVLGRELPLTYYSHPNCRGSYSPYMGLLSEVRPIAPIYRDVAINGNLAKKVPPEYVPWVRHVFLRDTFPFTVQCVFGDDRVLDRFDGRTLYINIKAMGDKDIREIILETKAKILWPSWRDKFMKEYMPLVKTGLVTPVRVAFTSEDVFVDGYISFKLKQLDEPAEIIWWGENFS